MTSDGNRPKERSLHALNGKRLARLGPGTVSVAAIVISALSAFFSMQAATTAAEQTQASKEIPFQAALYTARVEAMQVYAKAVATFDNSLKAALIDLVYEVDTAEELRALTSSNMQRNALVGRRIIDTHAEFVGTGTAVIALWSEQTRLEIQSADQLGAKAALCFLTLGAHPYAPDPQYFQDLKKDLIEPCRDLNDRRDITAFLDQGTKAVQAMQSELQALEKSLVPTVE